MLLVVCQRYRAGTQSLSRYRKARSLSGRSQRRSHFVKPQLEFVETVRQHEGSLYLVRSIPHKSRIIALK